MEGENKKPKNPNAFPIEYQDGEFQTGMTLRDYFANSAMQAFTNIWYEDAKSTPESIAKKSYKLADAMLKEREKQE